MGVRVHVLSDLHSEFGEYSIARPAADVVVLAGDVGVRQSGLEYARQRFADIPVVYVAGNHEYYDDAIPLLAERLRAATAGTNVRFLENEAAVIAGVRFLGCTLWTDLCLLGEKRLPLVLGETKRVMMDCRRIRRSPQYRGFDGRDMVEFHKASREWLTAKLAEPFEGPTVVVTHHAPSARSLGMGYEGDVLSPVYASHLDTLVESSGARLWVHGHTHRRADYWIGQTRVISNPRGYPGSGPDGFKSDLVIDVG